MENIKRKPEKVNNEGFSLITVLIAVSFVGILSMLVLYISLANLQMKTTDLFAKDSFYSAEKALDEIRAGLQEELGESMSKAYTQVLETYSRDYENADESLDVLRQQDFKRLYLENLGEALSLGAGSKGEYNLEILKGYVDMLEEIDKQGEDATEILKILNRPAPNNSPILESDFENGIVLKNIRIVYVDPKGRTSIIETDIRLGVPQVQFPTPSTLPDLMSMIVVANAGVICEKGELAAAEIKGSIYAGEKLIVDEGATLNITGGERAVCEGEIQIKDRGTFKSSPGVSLWAQGLAVSSGHVELLGTTYFADDITVNEGQGSSVKISGEYYGFGSPESAKASMFAGNKYDKWTDAALNSSIVINGKGTTLDLSNVNKMMLAGNNFIGTKTVTFDDSLNTGNLVMEKNKDILTGESISVKGTQLAYLVPSQCLFDGKRANPMTYDMYLEALTLTNVLDCNIDEPIDAWGGRTLRNMGVDEREPYKKVFYSMGQDGFVYFYLNFSDSQKASEFFKYYYRTFPGAQAAMDQYLSFYLGGENQGILMEDPNTFLRYVTNGNVLTYEGGENKNQGQLYDATINDKNKAALLQEQTNYQNMWYALTRKMISSVDLLKKYYDKSGNVIRDETDSENHVFENLVDVSTLKEFVKDMPNKQYKYPGDDQSLCAYVQDNAPVFDSDGNVTTPGTEFVITEEIAEYARLVVCTGDVRIKKGVNFYGIIMCQGTLTLEPGAKLESASREAAKVFQAQKDEAQQSETAPMDFFWEGDKYVLGNTQTEEEEEKAIKTNTYDLSEYVNYENWNKK